MMSSETTHHLRARTPLCWTGTAEGHGSAGDTHQRAYALYSPGAIEGKRMNQEPFAGAPDGRHFRPRFLPGRPSVEVEKAGLPAQNRSLHGGGKGAHAPEVREPKLLDQVREAIRMRHYIVRTEEAYVGWIKRVIFFHGKRHPLEVGQQEITQFLSALAVKEHVSASTQNQALCALLFLYREILARDIG
jgi:Phage integrase, N-terminal SAM-like domain